MELHCSSYTESHESHIIVIDLSFAVAKRQPKIFSLPVQGFLFAFAKVALMTAIIMIFFKLNSSHVVLIWANFFRHHCLIPIII